MSLAYHKKLFYAISVQSSGQLEIALHNCNVSWEAIVVSQVTMIISPVVKALPSMGELNFNPSLLTDNISTANVENRNLSAVLFE